MNSNNIHQPMPDQCQTQEAGFVGTIRVPLETNPLSLNEIGGMNRYKKARLVKQWRTFAAFSAKRFPSLDSCDVTLTWFTTIKRVRDEDNMALLLKSLCDGLVDAGVVPDDSPEFMGKACRIERAPEGATTAYMELKVDGR
jgi:crossover junction endodeoxyribonuclease RusA